MHLNSRTARVLHGHNRNGSACRKRRPNLTYTDISVRPRQNANGRTCRKRRPFLTCARFAETTHTTEIYQKQKKSINPNSTAPMKVPLEVTGGGRTKISGFRFSDLLRLAGHSANPYGRCAGTARSNESATDYLVSIIYYKRLYTKKNEAAHHQTSPPTRRRGRDRNLAKFRS